MKVLFVTSNRVGDAVLSTGLLGHILDAHPGARTTIACGPAAVSLFDAVPNVDRILAMEKKPYGRHWASLWAQVVTRVWDIAVDLRASALPWLVMAHRRFRLRRSEDAVHRVVLLARTMNLDPPPPPRVWLDVRHRATARALLPNRPVLGIGPTANWGGKQWPAASFLELAARLTAPGAPLAGAPVAVFGAAGERDAVAPLLANLPEHRTLDLVGRTDLAAAAACLERCSLYIGNDSGLMHLSAATGTPTLGLFGPSPEVHYAPWGPHAAFVRTPASFEEIVGAPGYDYRSQRSLMAGLTVDRVEEAALSLIERAGLRVA